VSDYPVIDPVVQDFNARCMLYALLKLDWLEEHPDASADEVEAAMRRIALELNL
jgi:hypothetical protein